MWETIAPARICLIVMPAHLDPARAAAFVADHTTFVFDCDGVLWTGGGLLPGVRGALLLLRRQGKRLVFATNNLTRLRRDYVDKFALLGVEGVEMESMFTAGYAAAVYLSKVAGVPRGLKVWALGGDGLVEELELAGYTVLGGPDPRLQEPFLLLHPLMTPDPEVRAVVVLLFREMSYLHLAATFQYVATVDPPIPFIGTNPDTDVPVDGGRRLPGSGCTIAFMATGLGRTPVMVGKPAQGMMDAIAAATPGFDLSTACMVGDRIDTDMTFGAQAGIDTVLVLTGISSEHDALASSVPTYYALLVAVFAGES